MGVLIKDGKLVIQSGNIVTGDETSACCSCIPVCQPECTTILGSSTASGIGYFVPFTFAWNTWINIPLGNLIYGSASSLDVRFTSPTVVCPSDFTAGGTISFTFDCAWNAAYPFPGTGPTQLALYHNGYISSGAGPVLTFQPYSGSTETVTATRTSFPTTIGFQFGARLLHDEDNTTPNPSMVAAMVFSFNWIPCPTTLP